MDDVGPHYLWVRIEKGLISNYKSAVSCPASHISTFPGSRPSHGSPDQTRTGGSCGGFISFICWTRRPGLSQDDHTQCTMTVLWITHYNFPSVLLPQLHCDNIWIFSRSRDYRFGQCSGSASAPTLSTFSSSSVITLETSFSGAFYNQDFFPP